MTDAPVKRPAQNPLVKLSLEMGPLVVFFIANAKYGIFPATAALMVGVVVALVASWFLTRHIPVMPLVTAVMVLLFGGLTLIFQDETFIKLKPTIVNILFGVALLGALGFGKPLLPIVLDSAINLTEKGWRILTLRWGLFFFFLAGLNELVWRTQTTEFWAGFKVFGTMPITMLFALSQLPLILKHEHKSEDEAAPEDHW